MAVGEGVGGEGGTRVKIPYSLQLPWLWHCEVVWHYLSGSRCFLFDVPPTDEGSNRVTWTGLDGSVRIGSVSVTCLDLCHVSPLHALPDLSALGQ